MSRRTLQTPLHDLLRPDPDHAHKSTPAQAAPVATDTHMVRVSRALSVGDLMYVKEDLIIPHSTSFYDLIMTRARGKTGPLFFFDVHEDLRLQSDARRENNESHAGEPVLLQPCHGLPLLLLAHMGPHVSCW